MTADCPKELEQQSPHHCYGTVQDDEPIVYVLVEPDHYRDGDLQKNAFSHRSLKTGELSVCRARYSSRRELQHEVVDKLLQGEPPQGGRRRFVGLFQAMCWEIRRISVEYPKQNRAICVIDDGQPSFQAHAHLSYSSFAREKNYWEKNNRQAVRANLIEAFGKGAMLSLQDVFGPQAG
jgi:hypothetical protein